MTNQYRDYGDPTVNRQFNSGKTAPFCPVTLFVFRPLWARHIKGTRYLVACPHCDIQGRKTWQAGFDGSKPGRHEWTLQEEMGR